MRSIKDHTGATWDVVVGKESYGSMVLFFSRRGDDEVRRLSFEASSRLEAERMLRTLDAEALRSRLGVASVLSERPYPPR